MFQAGQPLPTAAGEAGCQQVPELRHERPIASGCPDDQQSPDGCCRLPSPDCLHLAIEAAKVFAQIREQVDDFDDHDLQPAGRARCGPFEEDIDRAVDVVGGDDRRLGAPGPAAQGARRDDDLLSTEVLDIPGRCRAGREFKEGGQLEVERGAEGCPGFDRRVRREATFRFTQPTL